MSSDGTENVLLLNVFCRICMDKTEEYINLFDNPTSHRICRKIFFCAGIQPTKHDLLPNKICLDCLHLLEAAYSFKNVCIESDALCKQILFGDMKAVIERNTFVDQLTVLKSEKRETTGETISIQNVELNNIDPSLNVDTVRRVNVYKNLSKNTESTTKIDIYVPSNLKLKNELKEEIKKEIDVCDLAQISEVSVDTNENDCDWTFEPFCKEDSDIEVNGDKPEENYENDNESINNLIKVEIKNVLRKEKPSRKTETTKERTAKERVKSNVDSIYHKSDDEFSLNKKSTQRKLKCRSKENKVKKQVKVKNVMVKCEICEAQVKKNSYNFHKQKHGPLLKCQECQYATYFQKRFDKHLIRHKEGKHVCKVCKANFKTVTLLIQHSINDHGTNKVYECDICFKGYADKYNMFNHLEKVHFMKPKRPRKQSAKTKGKGPEKQSKKEEIQKRNISYHRRLQICDVCGINIEEFKLYYHRLKHFPKGFICDVCTKGFYMKRDLEHHMRVTHLHNTEHVCRICGLASRCASHLRNHMETRHSSELKYACHVCGKGFRSMVLAKHHVAQHFGDRGYQVTCRLCNLSMKNHRYRMDEHMLKTHNVNTKGVKSHDLLEIVRLITPMQKKIISQEYKNIKKINAGHSTSQYSLSSPSTSLSQAHSSTHSPERSKPVGFKPTVSKPSNAEVHLGPGTEYSPTSFKHPSREEIQFSPISLKQQVSLNPVQFSPAPIKQQVGREIHYSPDYLKHSSQDSNPSPLSLTVPSIDTRCSPVLLKQHSNRNFGPVPPIFDSGNFNRVSEQGTGNSTYNPVLKQEFNAPHALTSERSYLNVMQNIS